MFSYATQLAGTDRIGTGIHGVNDSRIVPVFIFSLPRTGSTLLQRLLAVHPDVSTAAEPWMLLPILYARRERGVVAEYGHRSQVRAFEDFRRRLPRADEDVDEAIRTFALSLYEKASDAGSRYFIDKTPRYHLVVEDIIRVFGSSARYLFLWRNPLAVVASIISTWGKGRWKFNTYHVDLFRGLAALTDAFRRHASTAHSLNYENLVREPRAELEACLDYIGLDPLEDLVDRFATIHLPGRMGDHTGVSRYQSVSSEPLDSWKNVIVGPYRRGWARRYLSWIGSERLEAMGYDSQLLLEELASTPKLRIGRASDPWYEAMGLAKESVRTYFISRLS